MDPTRKDNGDGATPKWELKIVSDPATGEFFIEGNVASPVLVLGMLEYAKKQYNASLAAKMFNAGPRIVPANMLPLRKA